MKTTLAKNLFIISGVLTRDECDELIERGESLGFQQASVRTVSGPQMHLGIRNNDRAELCDLELAERLWNRCLSFIPQQLEGGTACGLDDNFRFYRYDIGQRFKRHKDGVVERPHNTRSRLSCLFYLNDGFKGGETVFYSSEVIEGIRKELAVVVPQKGDALFFLHEWWHEGRELVEGRKYVLRSDVFYRFPDVIPSESK